MNAAQLRTGRPRALVFTVGALIAGITSYVIGVRSELGQQAEQTVLDASKFTTSPPAPLNLVSTPSVVIAIVLIAAFALAIHGVRRAIIVAVVPTVAIIASQLLKQQFLERPGFLGIEVTNTFPSGHMTVFAVVVAAAIWAVPATWRSIVGLLGAITLGIVAWQLLAYGWHRPSDVLGALSLAVLGFSLAALIAPTRSAGRAALGTAVRVILIVAIAGMIVVTLLALSLALMGGSSRDLMLLAGEAGVVSASTLATWMFIALSARRR
ncbi:MAG: phosphatase PAP2 family protein [Leucobacter sp.]